MPFYRKKAVVVEAEQFTTNDDVNWLVMNRIVNWINHKKSKSAAWHNGTDIFIVTLEGEMKAGVGDWIIKGLAGEFYPCKDAIFTVSYDPVSAVEETDLELLKRTFDKFGVKYEMNGEILETDEGEGYTGYFAAYVFNSTGKFVSYGVKG